MRNPYHHHEKKRTVGEIPSQEFHGNSECSMIPVARNSLSDGLTIQPIPPSNPQPTWCQSYLSKPRILGLGNHTDDTITVWKYSSVCHDPIHVQCVEGMGNNMFGSHRDDFVLTQEAEAIGASGTARPRVRARRGQATDPHSIAERLRRERIAERMKALQEMVPSANKSDKASVLDEIIEYVKFLQLQVKVLSMSRLDRTGFVLPLTSNIHVDTLQNVNDLSSCEDGTLLAEGKVVSLMEEDMGSAMAFLQAKGLCLMPIALASAISRKTLRPVVGHSNELQGLSKYEQSKLNAASSSSSCVGGEGDSNNLGQVQQQWS